MILEACACTDVGLKRTNNEDNFFFNGLIKNEQEDKFGEFLKNDLKKTPAVFGVFDGMGGYSKGERASFLTAETARKIFSNNFKGNPKEALHSVVNEANDIVCEEIISDSNLKMGSTLSMLYFENDRYHVCDVGDSPIFLFRSGELNKISLEHTEAELYRKIYGDEPPKEKKFPLTRHIGIPKNKIILEPYYNEDNLFYGDIFVICSDGLTDMVDDCDIAAVLQSNITVTEMCNLLVKKAIENGGNDNITVIVIKIDDDINEKRESDNNIKNIKRTSITTSSVKITDYDDREEAESNSVIKIITGVILFIVLLGLIVYGISHRPESGTDENSAEQSVSAETNDNIV